MATRTPAQELEALARDQALHVLKYVANDVNGYVLMPRDRDPLSVRLADIRPDSGLRLHVGSVPGVTLFRLRAWAWFKCRPLGLAEVARRALVVLDQAPREAPDRSPHRAPGKS